MKCWKNEFNSSFIIGPNSVRIWSPLEASERIKSTKSTRRTMTTMTMVMMMWASIAWPARMSELNHFNRSPNVSFEYSAYRFYIWSSNGVQAYMCMCTLQIVCVVINNMRVCCKSFCLHILSNFEICFTHTHYLFVLRGLCLCVCVTLELMSFVRSLHIIFGNGTICACFFSFKFCLSSPSSQR